MGYAKPVNANAGSRWGVYPSGRTHKALDYPVPVGTRVQNAMAGKVTTAGWSTSGFGWHVRVLYDSGKTGIYGHLSKISVKVGQRVAKYQTLGYSGNSGNSTGPHLHWEIRTSSWNPLTSWNFTAYIEPYYPPKVTSTVTSFNRSLLKYGKTNTEVKRFQQWLWSKQPASYKTWFRNNMYDFDKYGFTNNYRAATARMVRDTYKRLDAAHPTGGWDSGVVKGVWPNEPGAGLFKYYGATSTT